MRKLPTFIALCLLTCAAHAADNGVYLGVGLDAVRYTNFDSYRSAFFVDDATVGVKVIAGVRLLDSFAVEANYTNFNEALFVDPTCVLTSCTNSAGSIAATGFSQFAVGFLHFPVVDAFAKIGLSEVRSKARFPTNISFNDNRYSIDLAWGVGAQAHFGSFAVRGEFERYTLYKGHRLRQLSVSVLYTLF
jgi:hypothetical protein